EIHRVRWESMSRDWFVNVSRAAPEEQKVRTDVISEIENRPGVDRAGWRDAWLRRVPASPLVPIDPIMFQLNSGSVGGGRARIHFEHRKDLEYGCQFDHG